MKKIDFIERVEKTHGKGRYDLSLVPEEFSINGKVNIICHEKDEDGNEHGVFYTSAKNFAAKSGCPKCGRKATIAARKSNTEEFIERSIKIHGSKYNYSEVDYKGNHTKVKIICPEHGEFMQSPHDHLIGCGCPKCGSKTAGEKMTKGTDEFVDQAKQIHGDKYDYTEVEYVNNKTKVKIHCNTCGTDFYQTPLNHTVAGQGCPNCAGKQLLTKEKFIEKSRQVHGDIYDYSKAEYINATTPLEIICPKHGSFWQTPIGHYYSWSGCPKCGTESMKKELTSTTEEFIDKAKAVHGDKYDYSKVVYVNNRTKVCIICPKHGKFWMTPQHHLHGENCPKCVISSSTSKAEIEIYEFVCSLIGKDKVLHGDRKTLNGKELDIFVPSLKIAIEYNGLHWHSDKSLPDDYHMDKMNACNKRGIKLIQIFEDEYDQHKEIVLAKIKHLLGFDGEKTKIYARKCEVREILNLSAECFLNQHHIQGFANSTAYLGAFYNNELIAVMSFKREAIGHNDWELTRFATNNSYTCCGIGGKLFSYFISLYAPDKVKSFADRRWTLDSQNNLYTKIGFVLTEILKPDYRYVVGKERVHKSNFRKQAINKKYGLPMTMTETEMMAELGIPRIYDCGLLKYEWKKE